MTATRFKVCSDIFLSLTETFTLIGCTGALPIKSTGCQYLISNVGPQALFGPIISSSQPPLKADQAMHNQCPLISGDRMARQSLACNCLD
jgi:hypothetical protein